MRSLSSVGLGLSVVFTCLLLALVAEIYYLLWWKRRITRRETSDDYPARQFCYMFCWKRQATASVNNYPNGQMHQLSIDQELQLHSHNKDYTFKPFDEDGTGIELITGPPRFLFTIKEETREDLESEDCKSRDGKRNSLNELMKHMETPYVTPLSSPPFLTPPLTPMGSCHSSQSGGAYNPFHESSTDAEFNRIVKSSPPPKFKFLRDAEEKLQRRIMSEQAKNEANLLKNEEDGSFITIIVAKNKENDKPNHHYHSPQCHSSCSSSSSQVLPLASSPSISAPPHRKFKSILTK